MVAAALIALAAFAWFGAFVFAYDFRLPDTALARCLETLPWLLVLRAVLAHRFRLDRSLWKHVGLRDLEYLLLAITVGSALFPLVLLAIGQLREIPVVVFFLDWLLAVALTAGVRIAGRLRREGLTPVAQGQRTFIVGAGEAGEQLLRQILHDQRRQFQVVGLIDDDQHKHGLQVHGVTVCGGSEELRRLVAMHQVSLVLIAIPSATPEQLRKLVDRGVAAGAEVKLLPPFQDQMTADIRLTQVRDVQIEDLLGREPVQLDMNGASPDISGKVVLVTGAGGSIGSELVRQIAIRHPLRLILLERAESPLYFIQLEIQRGFPAVDVVPVLASVTNEERLQQVFDRYQPDIVFHAAAYKHVPMLEANPAEGVWNNVMGTLRLARVAARTGTRKFVFISTDKAVNPTSVLGTTKRVAERIVLELPSLRTAATDFRVVRFGNVLGSDGSVVPLFKKQLAAGGPLTVTHPEVKRYFMTIPEAVQLVLQAASLPEAAGRIALLEMGTQVRIVDLAEQLIRLAGLVPHEDIKIEFTGLRPGEKIEEELLAPGEKAQPSRIDKIRIVERDGADGTLLAQRLRHLLQLMARNDNAAVSRALAAFIPDNQPAPATVHQIAGGNGRKPAGERARPMRRTMSIREARQVALTDSAPDRRDGTHSRP